MATVLPENDHAVKGLSAFWTVVIPIVAALAISPVIVALSAILMLWFIHLWNIPFWSVCVFGSLIAVYGIYFVWFLIRALAHRRFQFSLRSMLIATAVFALVVSLLWNCLTKPMRQQLALLRVVANGVNVTKSPYDIPGNWLQKQYDFDPFSAVYSLDIHSDSELAVLLENSNAFADLTNINFRTGISERALERAEEFKQFPKLNRIGCIDANITDKGLEYLVKFTKLNGIFISGYSRVTDNGLRHLTKLLNLEYLHIYTEPTDKPITDIGLKYIGKMARLRDLILVDCAITDGGLKHLHNLKGLEKMLITSKNITDIGILDLSEALPDCFVTSNLKLNTKQFQRLSVKTLLPKEKEIYSTTDQKRISEIDGHIDFSKGELHEVKDGQPQPLIQLDFQGLTRRLYRVQIGKGVIISQYQMYRSISEEEEKELSKLIGLDSKIYSTVDKPEK